MTKTNVSLSDADLATLASSTDEDVRAAALAARDRLAAPQRWPSLPPHVGALVADVLAEARKQGRLIYRGVSVSMCRYCGARSEWKVPPRKRKEREYPVSGVEFADRFVVISRHITVGGCRACVEQALPVLRAELSEFPDLEAMERRAVEAEAAADRLTRIALPEWERAVAECAADRDRLQAERDQLHAEVERMRKHVEHNDEEYRTMKDVLRAEHEEVERMRPVFEAAKAWRELHRRAHQAAMAHDSTYEIRRSTSVALDALVCALDSALHDPREKT